MITHFIIFLLTIKNSCFVFTVTTYSHINNLHFIVLSDVMKELWKIQS